MHEQAGDRTNCPADSCKSSSVSTDAPHLLHTEVASLRGHDTGID